jgi:hypothetical protein
VHWEAAGASLTLFGGASLSLKLGWRTGRPDLAPAGSTTADLVAAGSTTADLAAAGSTTMDLAAVGSTTADMASARADPAMANLARRGWIRRRSA